VLLLVSVGVLIVVAVVDVVVVVVVGGGGVVKEKKLENGERPMMAPPKPRKPKSIRRAGTCQLEVKSCV